MPDDPTRKYGEETGKPQPPVEHQFKPGNPGRPKGSRNKLAQKYTDDLLEVWQEKGIEAIKALAPVDLVRAVGATLPKEQNIRIGDLDELTDDQLSRQLASGLAQLAAAGLVPDPRDGPQGEAQPAPGVSTVQ